MLSTDLLPRVFMSGDIVEPGLYRDTETGSLIRVYQRDSLPAEIRVVHTTRIFMRVTERDTAHSEEFDETRFEVPQMSYSLRY